MGIAKSPEKLSRMKELYLSGMTQREVALELGCSPMTVSTLLRQLEVPIRPLAGGPRGKDSPNYKGSEAGYRALHLRVERARGKPRLCEKCGTTEAVRYEWALRPGGSYENIDDYDRLCPSCHHTQDGIINNIVFMRSRMAGAHREEGDSDLPRSGERDGRARGG